MDWNMLPVALGGAAIVVCILFIIFIVAGGVKTYRDTHGVPERSEPGKVYKLWYNPAYTTFIFGANNTMTPVYHSESYNVNVKLHGKITDSLEIEPKLYNQLEKGDMVLATYKVGRNSGDYYLYGVKKV